MQLSSLQDVFQEQLEDLYDAEQQLVKALPKVANATSTGELREAFDEHLEETKGHVEKLQQVFSEIGITASGHHCDAMEGLIKEGEEIVSATGDPTAKDAALIAAAQRIEHYEIAGYGTAKTLAGELGHSEAASILGDILDEESAADKLLTKIATGGMMSSGLNKAAAH
jgi:ferritin-like metal-binding protein YciE